MAGLRHVSCQQVQGSQPFGAVYSPQLIPGVCQLSKDLLEQTQTRVSAQTYLKVDL